MEDKKLKLVIQIPCLNEASSLPRLFKEMPRHIEKIGRIETLVIDDGSSDRTKEVAKESGASRVIGFSNRKGLARAFITGIDASLKMGADIIVNLDADGQYDPADIPKLIKPIVEEKADMVIGARDIDNLRHFSLPKKKLQKIGSWVVRKVSDTNIPDVTSGFRAFSRQAALSVNVVSNFTYTIETLIQAGNENISLEYIKVKTRPVTRKSRLFKTVKEYIAKSVATTVRIYTMYSPFKVFTLVATSIFVVGLFVFARFLYFYFTVPGTRPIQHLIVVSAIMLLGFHVFLIGIIADLISANRRFIEDILKRVKGLEISGKE